MDYGLSVSALPLLLLFRRESRVISLLLGHVVISVRKIALHA